MGAAEVLFDNEQTQGQRKGWTPLVPATARHDVRRAALASETIVQWRCHDALRIFVGLRW